jgi:hypothetical protein
MTQEEVVREVASDFNKLFYFLGNQTWHNTRWMGVVLYKFPTDLWVYQEIVHETRPTLIIETGTAHGGSALFFAHLGSNTRPRTRGDRGHRQHKTRGRTPATRSHHVHHRLIDRSVDRRCPATQIRPERARHGGAGQRSLRSPTCALSSTSMRRAGLARMLPDRRGHERQRASGLSRARPRAARGGQCISSVTRGVRSRSRARQIPAERQPQRLSTETMTSARAAELVPHPLRDPPRGV